MLTDELCSSASVAPSSDPGRAVKSRAIGSSSTRRAKYESERAEGASAHWASSTTITSGLTAAGRRPSSTARARFQTRHRHSTPRDLTAWLRSSHRIAAPPARPLRRAPTFEPRRQARQAAPRTAAERPRTQMPARARHTARAAPSTRGRERGPPRLPAAPSSRSRPVRGPARPRLGEAVQSPTTRLSRVSSRSRSKSSTGRC